MADDPETQRHLRPGRREERTSASRNAEAGSGNPWERRAWIGFWRGLWETTRLFVSRPAEGFAVSQPRRPIRDPLLFALAVMLVAGTVAGLVESAVELAMAEPGEPTQPFPFGLSIGERNLDWLPVSILSLGGCLVGLLFLPFGLLFLVLFLLAGSGILHLCLLAVGGLRASQTGYLGTFRVVCYGSVAMCAYPVPWVGVWLYLAWGIALQALGFSIVHRTGWKRALLAALLPILALAVIALSAPGAE